MKRLLLLCLIPLATLSHSAQAGPFTDSLSECLVRSSNEADKLKLVKWMFTAMSLHPAVESMAAVNEKARMQANKDMAELMVDLLTVRCLNQAQEAIEYEGQVAMQASFSVLGQVAGTDLFSNTEVAQGLSGLDAFIDYPTLNEKLGL